MDISAASFGNLCECAIQMEPFVLTQVNHVLEIWVLCEWVATLEERPYWLGGVHMLHAMSLHFRPVCTRRGGCRVLDTLGACRCFIFLTDRVDS